MNQPNTRTSDKPRLNLVTFVLYFYSHSVESRMASIVVRTNSDSMKFRLRILAIFEDLQQTNRIAWVQQHLSHETLNKTNSKPNGRLLTALFPLVLRAHYWACPCTLKTAIKDCYICCRQLPKSLLSVHLFLHPEHVLVAICNLN